MASPPTKPSRASPRLPPTPPQAAHAYAHILFEHFLNTRPTFTEQRADAAIMLQNGDAALLIGDPALLAREHRSEIDAAFNNKLLWLDLATLWRGLRSFPGSPPCGPCVPRLSRSLASRRSSSSTISLPAATPASRTSTTSSASGRPASPSHLRPSAPISPATSTTRSRPIAFAPIGHFRKLATKFGTLPPLADLNLLS